MIFGDQSSTLGVSATAASLDVEPFGILLRRYRKSARLTQEELAERSGISVRAIADAESCRTSRPHRRSVELLAEALRLTESEGTKLAVARSGNANGYLTGSSSGQMDPVTFLPRQLPAAVPHFVGRAAELDLLTCLLDDAADGAGTGVISAIAGTVGVGKTALAVRWAHLVAEHFADGQLYVNLRGFDQAGAPVPAAEAICRFLDAMGVQRDKVPASLDAQVGLYRSVTADRRLLIVLDNARDESQVRPLLPGTPGCMVLVTSRNRLRGLVAVEGAVALQLGVLSAAEARELLSRRLGAVRVAREPAAVSDLIRLCACLPLGLAVVASRASGCASSRLADIVAELNASPRPLDALSTGDAASCVRTAFSWSYNQLSQKAARFFRLLSLNPGEDIEVEATATLAGIPSERAREVLDELANASLVSECSPGRFTLDDLARAYAVERADRNLPKTKFGTRSLALWTPT